jgi:heme-degrading monooxygenase HmoA
VTDDTLISDRTDNYGSAAGNISGHVLLINLFTPKDGQENAFIEAQTGEYRRLLGKVEGWIGNRLGRSVDGKHLVNVAVFDSLANYNAWRESDLFTEHLDIIRPFVEKSSPGMYEILYSAGDIP